jgi:uncharacterized protein YndB with AHSA1/START domain
MSKRSTAHATFVIERSYDHPPARVFAAWADPAAKVRWWGNAEEHELDFRVGGRERLRATGPDGALYAFDATYQDIVEGERIVYSYDMHRNTDRISVTVATVELSPHGEATKLRFTEQGVYLDGHDTPAAREHGTNELLDALAAELARAARAEVAR